MNRHKWTAEESARLVELFPTHSAPDIAQQLGVSRKQVYARAQHLRLKKSSEWIREHSRKAMANPNHPGRKAQFSPGHAAWNKGVTGYMTGNATSFKKGAQPHTWRPIGTTRTVDGYMQRKVTDTHNTIRDYVPVHHLVWRLHGRSISKGQALVFRDGNKSNPDINNLELITRAELMRRNSVHRHGPEIAQISQLIGAINRRINRKENHA